jgi:hypothetical protein
MPLGLFIKGKHMPKIIIDVSESSVSGVIAKLAAHHISFTLAYDDPPEVKLHHNGEDKKPINRNLFIPSAAAAVDGLKAIGGTGDAKAIWPHMESHGYQCTTAGPALSTAFRAGLVEREHLGGRMIYTVKKAAK